MTNRTKLRLLSSVLVGCLLLVACGGSGSGSTSTSAPDSTSTAPSTSSTNPGETSTTIDLSQFDADVVEAYENFVKNEMPGVPIELIQAAKDEGSVTYYRLIGQYFADIMEEFRSVFPFIEVLDEELAGGPLAERFISESRSGNHFADLIIFSNANAAKDLIEEGFVLEYHHTLEDQLPAAFLVPGYIIPMRASTQTLAYNTNLINEDQAKLLENWEGLLDPSLKGARFAMSDISGGGSPQLLHWFFYKEFGTAMWERFVESGYSLHSSATGGFTPLVSGDAALAHTGTSGSLYPDWERGAPIRWVFPKPHLTQPYAQFISANAPHPSAAKLLHEFTMTRTAQQMVVNAGGTSFLQGIESTHPARQEPWYVDISSNPDDHWSYSEEERLAGLDKLIEDFRAHFGGGG